MIRTAMLQSLFDPSSLASSNLLGFALPAADSAADATYWFPAQASSFAADMDALWYFIYWVSVFFFVGIVAFMVLFVVRYRRTATRTQPERSASHNTALELTWSILPAVLLVAFFYWGWTSFLVIATPPRDAMEVQVGAYKWGWNFTYPSGHTDSELHVPTDREVKLIMSSADVLHSFWVPEFRTKFDVVPGRYTYLWFKPTRTGEFQLKCTEYCGTGHSAMRAKVVVHEAGGYEKWLEQAEGALLTMEPKALGELSFKKLGCSQCHSLDGTKLVGPSFKETASLWGKARGLSDGSEVTVDENYLRESILEPAKKIVAGYQPQMPVIPGIREKQIAGLIEYIKSLSGPNQ